MIHPKVESEESPSVKLNLCAPLTSTYTMCRLLPSRAQQGSARGGSGGLRFRGGEQLQSKSFCPDKFWRLDISQGQQGDLNLFNIGGSPCAEYITVIGKNRISGKTSISAPPLGQDKI